MTCVPAVSGFKPYGKNLSDVEREVVFLLCEEYESIRLCDYERLTQEAAAVEMEVSRPTLTRIYRSAREKVAKAFVEGRQLVIEGGKVYYASGWFVCKECGSLFNDPSGHNGGDGCPLCGSRSVEKTEDGTKREKQNEGR